ncbi:hypothetical protein [Embleya sp. NPDC020630]|uniref:hypothetical protein n=1 Tax=Embleya sp. NPDC020630 TaxID=3363979 RepID=UPI0037B7C6A9
MAIPMPDERALPLGARRELVEEFHRLYRDAGWPGTRRMAEDIRQHDASPTTVAHETLAGLLHGRAVPDWPRLESAVRHLASVSIRRPDADELVLRFHELWNAERDAAPPPSADEGMTGAEWFAIAMPDDDLSLFGDMTVTSILADADLDPDAPLTLRTALVMLAHLERQRHTSVRREEEGPAGPR